MIVVYDKNCTDFNNNGLVVLNDCKSCFITEQLNDAYYLELEYPKDKRGKYLNIEGLNIIKADGQLFRIPLLYKVQDNGISIKVRADHVFYDLNYDFIESLNIDSEGVAEALPLIISNPKFTVIQSNLSGTFTMGIEKTNPVKVLFNIIDDLGGELYRDNYNVSIKNSIGKDTGNLISYAKNITGFEQTLDYSNLATRIMPTGKDGITIDIVNNGSKYLDSPRINDYPFPMIKEVQFSDIDDAGELKTEALKLWGSIDLPSVNYTVNFVDLVKTEEYKSLSFLMDLHVGDTVLIRHNIFNVDLTAKVIKRKKNVLTGRVEEIELGQFKNNIAKTMLKMNSDVVNISSDLQTTRSQVQQTNNRIALVITQDGKIMPASIELSINNNESDIVLKADKIKFDTDGTGQGQSIVEIADGVLTADNIKALHLTVGNEIQMGADAIISWDQVEGSPTILSANDIKSTVITKDYIASLNLIVGQEIQMGSNAIITWSQVTGSPSFVTSSDMNSALSNYITSGTFSSALSSYVTSSHLTTVLGSDYIITGKISANQIATGSLSTSRLVGTVITFDSGCSIDTSNSDMRVRYSASNYLRISNSYAEFYIGGTVVGGIDSGGLYNYKSGTKTYVTGGGGVNYVFA